MGMDEVYQALFQFERELQDFNLNLKQSFYDLKDNHEAVLPLWDDAMKREYDEKWIPLEEKISEYITREGGSYVEDLLEKITALKGYLYGD